MTEQPTRRKSFWQTAPGILTGIATVLSGITGLLAILLQLGVIGSKDTSSAPAGVSPSVSIRSAPAASASSAGGWADASAIMTANDGTQYRSRASTFRYCGSFGGGVYFNNAQNIAFESMTMLEILRSDVALSPGGRADVRITLATSEVLTGTIDAGCDFIMQADAGRVDLYPDKVKKIEFRRP